MCKMPCPHRTICISSRFCMTTDVFTCGTLLTSVTVYFRRCVLACGDPDGGSSSSMLLCVHRDLGLLGTRSPGLLPIFTQLLSSEKLRVQVQCCFTSTETLLETGIPGRPPRLSHGSWAVWKKDHFKWLCSCNIPLCAKLSVFLKAFSMN